MTPKKRDPLNPPATGSARPTSPEQWLGPCCPHAQIRSQNRRQLTISLVPLDLTQLAGAQSSADEPGADDFDEQRHGLIHEEMVREPLIQFLDRVLSDAYLNELLRRPVGSPQLPLVRQLRLAGIEACKGAGLDPWPQDILYTATVLLGLQLHLTTPDQQQHGVVGRLRDIAQPAFGQLQQEGRRSAARLGAVMGWCGAGDTTAWLRGHAESGLRRAAVLPQGS